MSDTSHSSVVRQGLPSVHSFLFAFHVKDIIIDKSWAEKACTGAVQLEWAMADNVSGKYQSQFSQKCEPTPGSTHISTSVDFVECRACNVDTAFALLQCSNTNENGMGILGGAMNLRIIAGNGTNTCLASSILDFSNLEVGPTINIHKVPLRTSERNVVGSIELCYVSQQRWIKVNKRKLAFLGEQRSSNVKSVVEISAKYVNSALEGMVDATPVTNRADCFKKFTPREDDFVLLFWNSTKTCFVKNHADDYQLQLMYKFVRSPFFTEDGTPYSSRTDELTSEAEYVSTAEDRPFMLLSESGTVSSRPLSNYGVLQFPNIQRATTQRSSMTPTSDMVSDFTDEDFTMRSGLSSCRSPGSARLYDYLAEQNEQIQLQMTQQLQVPPSPWSKNKESSRSMDVSPIRTSNPAPVAISPVAFNILDSSAGNTCRSYSYLGSGENSMVNSFRDSDFHSDLDDWSSASDSISKYSGRNVTTLSPLAVPARQATSNIRRIFTSSAGQPADCLDKLPRGIGTRSRPPNKRNIDTDGFEVPSVIPRFLNEQKNLMGNNQSLSTFDGGSTCAPNLSQSFSSMDLDASLSYSDTQEPSKDCKMQKKIDIYSTVDSLLDTVSHFDIVEDMFCSVTVEDNECSPMSVQPIDLDRFYKDQELEPGSFCQTHDNKSTINYAYMEHMDLDARESQLIRTATESARDGQKHSLPTAIRHAILADINASTVSDLGIQSAECGLDVMSEALNDAKAMQLQQDKLSNELLMNFFLQLLNCYSQKGVPQAIYMWNVVQKHLSAADLMKFLPEDYNATVIRVALDILVTQLSMELPSGNRDQNVLGTEYLEPQNLHLSRDQTITRHDTIVDDIADNRSVDFFRPLSDCETYSESSEMDECFLPTKEIHSSQLRTQQFKSIMHRMYQEVDDMDPRKLVYISRLRSKPMKKRGCSLPLLAMKLALYRVFCGRKKLAPPRSRNVII